MAYTNAFAGKARKPTERELSAALGDSKAVWDDLVAQLTKTFGLSPEWNSYSVKAGWALRMKSGERNIVYLGPSQGGFRASFALGDKAVKTALASGLPARVKKSIQEAKRYAEGAAVRIEVKDAQEVAVILKLAEIKLGP